MINCTQLAGEHCMMPGIVLLVSKTVCLTKSTAIAADGRATLQPYTMSIKWTTQAAISTRLQCYG